MAKPKKPTKADPKMVAPKKSPAQKRAEKAKERQEWTQADIDAAILANGGIPKSTPEPKNKGGRPSKIAEIDFPRFAKLVAAGLTIEQLAVAMDLAPSTLYLYQKTDAQFSEVLKGSKAISDDRVERALFERACGYSHPEDKIFFDAQTGSVITEPTIKHYPPDTAAAFIWLKNRRPEQWKDRVENTSPNQPISLSITYTDAKPPEKAPE